MLEAPALRLRADLESGPVYRAGRSRSAAGTLPTHKLSSNENPYPPLPSVLQAITDGLATANRYPDSAAPGLVGALADRFEVRAENVALGAGSVDVISQLIRAVAGPGDEVVYAWRSFEAYPLLVRAAGATPVEVPLLADHHHDLAALAAAVTPRTRLIIVCTPNNPTGTAVGAGEMETFLEAVPSDIVVLLDEAYHEFNRRVDAADGIELFRRYRTVVVAHTFSKAYGLAGLRVGYAIAPESVVAAMRRVSVPFAVTDLAQRAALASLAAEAELMERVDALVDERRRTSTALLDAGWRLPASEGNFLWFPLGSDTVEAVTGFEEAGVLVRPFAGEGIRVTIGGREADDLVIRTAQALMARGIDGGAQGHPANEPSNSRNSDTADGEYSA